MKKLVLTLTAAMIFSWQAMGFAASSVDSLIQKLEDKGILTQQDAAQLKGEISQNEQASQQSTFKSMLPDWVNNIKLTGDFRFRDQIQERKIPGGDLGSSPTTGTGFGTRNLHQNRARIRARINFEDQINDQFKVVVGIATDGGTARSNNYTLGGSTSTNKDNATFSDSFGKPSLILNKAYAVYTPNSMITAEVGKMDNPIWEPANASFFWDPDITPEGGSLQLQKKINDYVTPWVQADVFDLHDATPTNGTKTDPFMMVLQGGAKGNLTDKIYYKAAASWYDVNNPSHLVFGQSLGTNTQITAAQSASGSAALKYNFRDVIVVGAEFGMNDPLGELLDNIPTPDYLPHPYIAQIGVFGDYAENQDTGDDQNKAWEMGAYMGNSAINGWGTWKIQSYYKTLERDSWLDIFPDDDFYSGDTNTKGWRTQLDIGLAKNVWFTMSYFRTNIFKDYTTVSTLTPTSAFSHSGPESLYQMDLNFKF